MKATNPENHPHRGHEKKGKPVAAHGRAWQSILTPFTEQIWQWRGQEEKTLRQIAELLAEKGITVAPSTVLRFIEARKRRRAKTALPSLQPEQAPTAPQKAAKPAPSPTPSTVPHDHHFSRVVDEGGKVLQGMQYGIVNPADL